MKKVFAFMILGLFVLSMVSVASVVSANNVVEKNVIVLGTIHNDDGTLAIANADVTVTCNGAIETATSDEDGDYGVEFDNSVTVVCGIGETVTVAAVKGDLFGTESDEVKDFILSVNLVVIDVPMTPEFGLIMGALTILSAAGIFFVVKRD